MHFKPIRFDLNHQSVVFVGKNWKSFENFNWIVKYSPTSFCGWLCLPQSHMEKNQIFSSSLISLFVFLLSCARCFIGLLFPETYSSMNLFSRICGSMSLNMRSSMILGMKMHLYGMNQTYLTQYGVQKAPGLFP